MPAANILCVLAGVVKARRSGLNTHDQIRHHFFFYFFQSLIEPLIGGLFALSTRLGLVKRGVVYPRKAVFCSPKFMSLGTSAVVSKSSIPNQVNRRRDGPAASLCLLWLKASRCWDIIATLPSIVTCCGAVLWMVISHLHSVTLKGGFRRWNMVQQVSIKSDKSAAFSDLVGSRLVREPHIMERHLVSRYNDLRGNTGKQRMSSRIAVGMRKIKMVAPAGMVPRVLKLKRFVLMAPSGEPGKRNEGLARPQTGTRRGVGGWKGSM